MNAGTALGLAVAGVAASEATGTTDFISVGPGSKQPETPKMPQVPNRQGIDPDTFVQALTAAKNSGGQQGADAGELANALSRAMQAGAQSASGQGGQQAGQTVVKVVKEATEKAKETTEKAKETTEKAKETTEKATGSDGSGSSGSSSGSSASASSSGPGHWLAQKMANDKDGLQGGDAAAAGFEAAKGVTEAGNTAVRTAGDTVDAVGKAGRTIREAGNLVVTGKADTSGTFAKNRGKVMFDYSGDGKPGGKLTDRLKGVLP